MILDYEKTDLDSTTDIGMRLSWFLTHKKESLTWVVIYKTIEIDYSADLDAYLP